MFRQAWSRRIPIAITAGLGGFGLASAPRQAHMAHAEASPVGLDPQGWKPLKVMEKEQVNHNTVKVRLGFESPEQTSGMSVASCIITRAPIGSKKEDGSTAFVIRPYTPVSEPFAKGYLDLVVKVYPEGKMSKHIGNLQVGDSLDVKGPIQKLPYKPNMKAKIGMIAGGSGITPMLQVVEEILRNPDDKTDVSLVFGNLTPKDILLKERLDDLAKKHSNFKLFYVVDKAPFGGVGFRGATGYITQDILNKQVPGPSEDCMILVCGPPPMMKAISGDKAEDKSQGELTGLLAKMGYTKEQVYKF